jgi:hypothetical protein
MNYPSPQVEGEIQHLLAEDASVAEQGVTVLRLEETIVLRGCVESEERRTRIAERVSRQYPDLIVRCELTVPPATAPTGAEALS